MQVAAIVGLLLIPQMGFAQGTSSSGSGIPQTIQGLTTWIYTTIRWPVAGLGLMVAAGLAKFTEDGVKRAVKVLVGSIAWALVPQVVTVLTGIFG